MMMLIAMKMKMKTKISMEIYNNLIALKIDSIVWMAVIQCVLGMSEYGEHGCWWMPSFHSIIKIQIIWAEKIKENNRKYVYWRRITK